MAVDFPGSPTNGQVFSVGGASWRYNGYAWARIPDPGEKGQKGQKGEKGEKGQKGQQGDKGIQGNFGGATFEYTFSSNTTDSDPGAGKLKLNNASVSSATVLFIDDTDGGSTNTDIQPFLRTIDDSTSTIKGHFRISNKEDADDFALFNISSITEASGYFKVNGSHISGSASSFSDNEEVIITFARTGDQGQKGEQGIQGVPGVQDKIFEGDTEAEVVDTGSNGHFKVTTEGTERLRCNGDGVQVQNGRFLVSGTFASIENESTTSPSLTLKKTTGNANSVDYLQLRNNINDLKLKISGDGVIFTSDVLASHEGDTDTQIRFPANDTIAFETAGTERFRIDNVGLATFTNDVVISNTLFFNKKTLEICKIDHDGANLDLHADGNVRFFESDSDKLMFTFDVNTVNNDARLIMENDTDTFFNHPGDNQLGFTVGGTDTMRITAGKVQIGDSTDAAEAPLHVTAENSQGINAIFGAKDFIDDSAYNYDDANIALQGRDADDNDTGAGIQFTVRNTGNSNWLHGAITLDRSGNYVFKNGGAGTTAGTEKFRFGSSGQLGLAGANYGTSGQVLTSQGGSSSPQWVTPTPNTNTTYDLITSSVGANVQLLLDASVGDDDPILITAGTNVSFASVSATGFTINTVDTTYDLATANGDNANEEKIQLTGTDSTTDTVTLAVSTGLSIARDTTTGKITLTNTDTGSGSNTFIGLDDTPSSFTANKTLKVNGDGDAVIFADDNNTTFALSAADGDTTTQEKIVLTGTNPTSTDNVILEVSTGLSIARTGNTITFSNTAPDTNTTYLLKAQQTSGNDTNPNLLLDASGSGTDDTVQLVGSGTVSVERNNDGQITITGTDTNTNTTYQLLARRQSNGGNSGTDDDPYLFLNASSGTDDSVRLVGSGSVSVERDNDGQITISGTDTTTNTTYDLITSSSGDNVVLTLDASGGFDDDPITITKGDNVSFTNVTSTGFTINTSATLDVTQLNLRRIRFGPGDAVNDDANIEWLGGSNDGYLRISTSDDGGAEYIELGDYDNVNLGGSFTRWMKLNRSELYMDRDVRLNAGLEDKDGQKGSSGQVLTSTGGSNAQVNWVNSSSVGTDTFVTNASFASITGGARLTIERNNGESDLTADLTVSTLGVENFTDLSDTPNDLSGQGEKVVRVNTDGNALEFVTSSSVGTDTKYDLLVPSETTKIRLEGPTSSGNTNDDIEIAGGTGITVTRNNANKLTITNSDTGSGANTTYDFSVPSGTTKLRLAGSDGDDDDVEIVGGTNVTVTRNNGNKLTISSTDTNTNTTYSAGGDYGMTLSGTEFRLKNDRRRNANEDVRSGNSNDYTFYDASHGIRWYTATSEDMRLQNNGDLHVDGDIIAFSTTISDIRLKKDLQIIQNPLDIINKINGYTFTYKKDNKKSAGVVAQEVEKVFPQAVSEKGLPFSSEDEENPDNYKTVEYDQIVGLLVQAVKELTDKVKKLEGR